MNVYKKMMPEHPKNVTPQVFIKLSVMTLTVMALGAGCATSPTMRYRLAEEFKNICLKSPDAISPNTIAQARNENVDYPRCVREAFSGDAAALHRLFTLRYLDGIAADFHAGVLNALLEVLGDTRFAKELALEKQDIKELVAGSLDYEIGEDRQLIHDEEFIQKCPATYAVLFSGNIRDHRRHTASASGR